MPTKSEILQKVLERFDLNNDSKVPSAEFKEALEKEGMDSETIKVMQEQVFQNWDTDKNAVLSKKELDALAEKWSSF